MDSQQQEFFQEEEINLRDYRQVVMKYRWTIFTLFTIIVVTVAFVTFKTTPVYKATAHILIDRENPNILSIEEVISVGARDINYYQTQYKILRSRSLAKMVSDALDLAHLRAFLSLILPFINGKKWIRAFLLLVGPPILRKTTSFQPSGIFLPLKMII